MIAKTNIIFESKRNDCYFDAHKGCVIKTFKNKNSYLAEKEMLESLSKEQLPSPKLLSSDNKSLSLEIEYIEGMLVLEQLEMYELFNQENEAIHLLKDLVRWLKVFYQLKSDRVYGDVNLRNFILSADGIVGIDFEQCGKGNGIEELEYLLAMYQLYDPKETKFKQLVSEEICTFYQINHKNVMEQKDKIVMRRLEKC